ncbi:MAG: DNA polymerase III subunit delta [Clostridia bacterium]
MKYADFFNAIKNDMLHGAYLLHGMEEFVKDSALEALLSTIDPTTRELNVQTAQPQSDAVISACETLPFFDRRRVVLCRMLPTGNDGTALRDYLARIPDSTLLIFFIRGKADGTTALYKALSKSGHDVSFDILTPDEAIKWILQQGKKHNVTIAPQSARYMLDIVGPQLSTLNNEFIKAASYAGNGNEITREVISRAVTRNIEYRVFDMVEYFLSGKAGDGARALSVLLKDGEKPIGIAALLSSRFKLMLAARECIDSGVAREVAIKRIGGNEYAAKKALESAKRYPRARLLRCISAFSDVSFLQISGAMRDYEALELALLRCSLKE